MRNAADRRELSLQLGGSKKSAPQPGANVRKQARVRHLCGSKPMYVLNHTEPEVWVSTMLQLKDKLILTHSRSRVFTARQAASALTRWPTLFANVTLHSSLSCTLLSHCGWRAIFSNKQTNPKQPMVVFSFLFSALAWSLHPDCKMWRNFNIVYASMKSTLFWRLRQKQSFLPWPVCGRRFPFNCPTTSLLAVLLPDFLRTSQLYSQLPGLGTNTSCSFSFCVEIDRSVWGTLQISLEKSSHPLPLYQAHILFSHLSHGHKWDISVFSCSFFSHPFFFFFFFCSFIFRVFITCPPNCNFCLKHVASVIFVSFNPH